MKNKLLPLGTRVSVRTRGYMPHWEVDQTFYFITYRLADSLPKHVIHQLRAEYRAAKNSLGNRLSLEQQAQLARWFHRRLDEFLDEGRGACHLKNPRAAQCVVDAWKYFDAASRIYSRGA